MLSQLGLIELSLHPHWLAAYDGTFGVMIYGGVVVFGGWQPKSLWYQHMCNKNVI